MKFYTLLLLLLAAVQAMQDEDLTRVIAQLCEINSPVALMQAIPDALVPTDGSMNANALVTVMREVLGDRGVMFKKAALDAALRAAWFADKESKIQGLFKITALLQAGAPLPFPGEQDPGLWYDDFLQSISAAAHASRPAELRYIDTVLTHAQQVED